VHLAKLSQPAVLSEACLSYIYYSSLDWVLGIFCVLLKIFYWLWTLTLNSFAFHNSRGSDDRDKYQEVLFFYPASDTILKSLQSPKTQGIKYKKETITTFRIPSTPFCPKSFQNPIDDMFLSCLYDNTSPHQVLPIKDDMFSSLLPSRIFILLLLLFSWCCFVMWTFLITVSEPTPELELSQLLFYQCLTKRTQ